MKQVFIIIATAMSLLCLSQCEIQKIDADDPNTWNWQDKQNAFLDVINEVRMLEHHDLSTEEYIDSLASKFCDCLRYINFDVLDSAEKIESMALEMMKTDIDKIGDIEVGSNSGVDAFREYFNEIYCSEILELAGMANAKKILAKAKKDCPERYQLRQQYMQMLQE